MPPPPPNQSGSRALPPPSHPQCELGAPKGGALCSGPPVPGANPGFESCVHGPVAGGLRASSPPEPRTHVCEDFKLLTNEVSSRRPSPTCHLSTHPPSSCSPMAPIQQRGPERLRGARPCARSGDPAVNTTAKADPQLSPESLTLTKNPGLRSKGREGGGESGAAGTRAGAHLPGEGP